MCIPSQIEYNIIFECLKYTLNHNTQQQLQNSQEWPYRVTSGATNTKSCTCKQRSKIFVILSVIYILLQLQIITNATVTCLIFATGGSRALPCTRAPTAQLPYCTCIESVKMKAIVVSLSIHSPTESRHCTMHCHSTHMIRNKYKFVVTPRWQYANPYKR